MPHTAHYLYTAAQTLLGIWDQVAEIASPYVPISVSPSPPPALSFQKLEEAVLSAPVNKLLRAEDLAHKLRDDEAFEDSSNSARVKFFCKTSCKYPCYISHGEDLDPGRSDFQQYTVNWDRNSLSYYWGAENEMPSDLPAYIQRGILMANMCDWSVFVLKPSVEKTVKLIDPEAEVIWLVVIPRRCIQFVLPQRPDTSDPRPVATAHSVLLIRSPRAGNFVLDPTGEQYGHPREHRFLRWRDYKQRYVLRKSKSLGGEVRYIGHTWEEDTQTRDDIPSYKFWQDAREIVTDCVDVWLQNMCQGDASFQDNLDNKQKNGKEDTWVRTDIEREMRFVKKQSPCWF